MFFLPQERGQLVASLDGKGKGVTQLKKSLPHLKWNIGFEVSLPPVAIHYINEVSGERANQASTSSILAVEVEKLFCTLNEHSVKVSINLALVSFFGAS